MDPKACLKLALTCLRDNDRDGLIDAIGDYHEWRLRGGFEPTVDGIKGDRLVGLIGFESGRNLRTNRAGV